jgi:RND family efflux transporter MFP subunit
VIRTPETRALTLLVGAGFLLSLGCGARGTEQAAAAPAIPAVAVAHAVRQNLSHDVVLTAEFIPFQEVDVMAKVAGYVKDIRVDVGDHVRAGQLLATIEVPEMQDDMLRSQASIAQAESEVAAYRDEIRRTESAHQIARLSFNRLASVVKDRPGLVAQQEIDDAQTREQIAEAQVAAAKSRLDTAQRKVSVTRADQARVKTMLGYTQVVAPFDGVITKRFANTGAMIQAGTASQTQAMPVVRVSQNSLLRLILPVPESIVPLVKRGQSITLRVPTLNRTLSGRVARFSDRVQSATRTMDTEIDVQNANGTLVPGMYAEVTFPTATRNDALTVPVTAVDLNPNADKSGKVMVVNASGDLESREVTLGLETAESYEILSGLNPADSVVLGNRATLRPGQRVRPKESTAVAAATH